MRKPAGLGFRSFISVACYCAASYMGVYCYSEAPDIRSVTPDLVVPGVGEGEPEPGRRVRVRDSASAELYHVLYLPTNFDLSKRHPLIVEFAGNGGYQNQYGDVSEGIPEGSNLGYGLSAGQDFVWLCLPFVSADRRQVAKKWWGSLPDYDPQPTVDYAIETVERVVDQWNLDREAIVLCGFSRGAIACNFIGLHDDKIAKLWCGMVAYSHYDGVRDWGLPGTDKPAALLRLRRLGDRPQFICHETVVSTAGGLNATRAYLEASQITGEFTFAETGFRNHNDVWVLRDSECRTRLRAWLRDLAPIQASLNHLP